MKKSNYILLVYFVTLVSCMDQSGARQQKNFKETRKTIVQDIRVDTLLSGGSLHNVRQLSKQLGLNSGDTGFDSLQIRVWFDHSLAYKKHLIVLEKGKKEWEGKLYVINVQFIDTSNYNIIESFTKKKVEPASSWKKLINELELLKIRDLSNVSQSGVDGVVYSVEVLSNDAYTYYDFWDPESVNDTNWQATNMVRIVDLLEREFKFESLKV
ncbi:hypothetical protein [Pseudobacter ginsenosidimutans]|uniref:Lipoprotein n=1 Tax=Pseudobacter ginsenosidimutans TaxID=661488 RepID=A0A4Q7N5V7_9BACT|nr:hypothetical protein [Pseudobacter ginsenosidimutans]QEC44952.1 hypothetical protein FSB84_25930 [Pseudobacter ginsenosidimutans]RZS76445.1 hypothetical protein EV199_2330 [Pseudobacter ginsenosidimutans]